MKKVKILLLLIVTVAGFYSCTDSNPVENEVVTSKSISLRTTLNAIKKANNISGKTGNAANDQAFCFSFVYPINLSYNDGTNITINSFEGLIDVLTNETNTLYIDGVAYPFQVQQEGTVTTIHSEGEFFALIQGCDFQTVNDCVFDFTCYEIVYPISIINQNQETIIIHNQAELMQLISTPSGSNSTYQLNIVFPISVIQNNQTIVIDDLYEFFDLNNDCSGSSCLCTTEYAPVCVQTLTGIVEYSNACFAECAGYTQNDFVSCNPTSICSLSNLSVTPGTCNTNGSYPLTINFTYDNPSNNQFEVRIGNSFIGTYSLSQLPLTVTYSGPNTPVNSLTVNIVGISVCSASGQFTAPNCSSPTVNFGMNLGTCFSIAYPVQVQNPAGTVITANNNGDVLQYWFPNLSTIPAFMYPVTVTFSGQNPVTMVVNNKPEFEAAIINHCN